MNAADLGDARHTLLHPRLSHAAGRAFFSGSAASLPFTGEGEPARLGARNALLRRLADRSAGWLPAGARRAVAEQLCPHRREPCTTFLARWRVEDPGSFPRPEQWPRASDTPPFRGAVQPQEVSQLAMFYGDTPLQAPETLNIQTADRIERSYRDFYYHAAPFDPRRRATLWSRCRPSEGACAQGLALARSGGARDGSAGEGQ